jgi:hypothetical protein
MQSARENPPFCTSSPNAQGWDVHFHPLAKVAELMTVAHEY